MVGLLYLPLSLYSYVVYGDSLRASVISSIQTSWIRIVADFGIGIHCFLTSVLVLNPLQQKMEHVFNAPHSKQHKCSLTIILIFFQSIENRH